ncbi:MAG TPA: hypothetical protein VEX38_03700 [Fimbriimonadaceae bacterium]|nr:hypothetical protein [Fimbriimonadaceae bacterium]
MTGQILEIPIRGKKLSMHVEIKEHLHHRKSQFQSIDIYDTEAFGKLLTLDGHVQLSLLDEHAYHECLVHIPLLSMDQPRRALVIGGGDGGVVRELCRHRTLTDIHMVEIDAAVIEACGEYLPELSAGALEDPRVEVLVQDAFPFVKDVTEPYDLIVMDSTDVYEGEDGALSERLFTSDFYRDCAEALSSEGMLVTQADNLLFCPYSMEGITSDLGGVFSRTGHYWGLVPSFGGFSGFVWASHGAEVSRQYHLERAQDLGLKYLTPLTYGMAMTTLPFGGAR